jgi:death-on-curing protein
VKPEPAWLAIEVVLAIHEQLVAEHGGAPKLRDKGLLESALAGPRHRFSYGEKDLFVLATSYAYGITRNHPFIDGNKCAAFMAAYTFLGVNGWTIEAAESEVVEMVLGLSDRSITEAAFTAWLRSSSVREPTVKRATRKTSSKRRSVRGTRRKRRP